MKKTTLFIGITFIVHLALVAKAETKNILNQILFSEGDQSWTSRDFVLYQKAAHLYLKQEKICKFSDSIAEDFLISRLLKREALLFEINPDNELIEMTQSRASFGEFSSKEIQEELKVVSYAIALLNLKEKQLDQKERFRAWVDVLKRKYQLKMKVMGFGAALGVPVKN